MNFFDSSIIKTFSKKKYMDIFPKLKDARIQKVTEISLTFIAIPIFGIFAISPTLITIAELRRKLADNQVVYSRLREKNVNLNTLQTNYLKIKNDLPMIFSAVPQSQKPILFMAELQGLAKKYSISLNGIDVSKIDYFGPAKYSSDSFAFSLSGSGSHQDALSFITAITNFQRVTTIDSVAIGKSAEKESFVRITISGKSYFKK